MRRPRTLAMFLAVGVLAMTPSAAAHTEDSAEPSACPEPHVDWQYDPDTFIVWATLPATGCPAREERQFPLWLSITRYEETSVHGVGRDVLCGPFPSSSESDGRRFSCEVDLGFDYREVEQARYEVQVNYPGADGPETTYLDLVCVSDESDAGCELEDDSR